MYVSNKGKEDRGGGDTRKKINHQERKTSIPEDQNKRKEKTNDAMHCGRALLIVDTERETKTKTELRGDG